MNRLVPIEVRRRDLKRLDPALYAYLTACEVSRALDRAGEIAAAAHSGTAAANRVWHFRAVVEQQRLRAVEASLRGDDETRPADLAIWRADALARWESGQ